MTDKPMTVDEVAEFINHTITPSNKVYTRLGYTEKMVQIKQLISDQQQRITELEGQLSLSESLESEHKDKIKELLQKVQELETYKILYSRYKPESLMEVFNDHYWDTFSDDKELILEHIHNCVGYWFGACCGYGACQAGEAE